MGGLRGIALALAAVLWAGSVQAAQNPPKSAVLLVEDATGVVLEAENATHLWYPASLTKVMTAYLVFEALADGRLALDQKVPVSEYAVAQPPTKLGLGLGKNVRVKLLLEVMIVRSANDAAVVLAEAVSGSEAAFAQAMTRKARALGMSQTVFTNASGLPDEGQFTTARDMVILARALIRNFPERYAFFAKPHFILRKRVRPTTTGWLRAYPGAEGIKSGFTCGSGYNLLSAAERDGRRLIGVVLGGRNSGVRNARMTKLMDRGFGTPALPQAAMHLEALPATPSGPAPYILPGRKCPAAPAIGTASATDGTLPGWGLVFGSFMNKTKASAAIAENRKALREVVEHGHPAIIAKTRPGPQRYAALLVGLREGDAGQACQHLRTQGIYCLAVPPKLLNSPHALWRN